MEAFLPNGPAMQDRHRIGEIDRVVAMIAVLLLPPLAGAVLGCNAPEGATSDGAADAAHRQTQFRIRSDFSAPLNADEGWAGDVNESVTVNVEEPFRIRFEVAHQSGSEHHLRLQYRRNGGEWTPVTAERFPMPLKSLEMRIQPHPSEADLHDWHVVLGDTGDISVVTEEDQPFLRIRSGEEPLVSLARSDVEWQPTEISAVVRLPDSGQAGVGIVFGYVDDRNYYVASVGSGDVLGVFRYAEGRAQATARAEVHVTPGEWGDLEVELEESSVSAEFEDGSLEADLESPVPASPIGLYVPPNAGVDVESVQLETDAATPRVSVIAARAYDHGDETTDLLGESDAPFRAGAGISLRQRSPSVTGTGVQTEWEWPLVIRRFADGAVTNDEGDRFEFRLTDDAGAPIPATEYATVNVAVPPNLLAGTFVETPGRLGPWEADNGDLYFIMEPAETYNVLMVVKSTDGGRTWQEIDGANRPDSGDLEGFATDYSDGVIHMLHQKSDEVLHHTFRTSDHPTHPDSWHIRDDTVATPEEPPTQVASITVRSDGSIVGVYGGPEKIHYSIRSVDGVWGEESVVDQGNPPALLSGPQTVLGEDDVVHLAYTGFSDSEGTVWYRRILPDGSLSPRTQLASGLGTEEGDAGSVLPLVYLPEANSVVIIYRGGDGRLYERRIMADAPPTDPVLLSERKVAQNAVDSDQAGADAIADGTTVHVLFIDEETGSIYHTQSDAPGAWQSASPVVEGITGQWIRGMPLTRGNDTPQVYGYVYDAGSEGGSGMNRYAEVPLNVP